MKNFPFKASLKVLSSSLLAAVVVLITPKSFADALLVNNNLDGSQTLTGHVPLEVKNGTVTLKYHALSSERINASIILPLQHQTQLNSLLKELYDPTNPNFHQFLTPTQFAQQFKASSTDSQMIQEYLKSQGISVTGQSLNGTVLNATGPVPAFEQAFGLHINHYQKTDGTEFFAPDTDPTIPATLAGKILAVGGLDNLARFKANSHQVAANINSNANLSTNSGSNLTVKPALTGTGPGGYLAPQDVKTAYNLNSIPTSGAGQTTALFELAGYNPTDIATYLSYFQFPSSNNVTNPCNYSSSTPSTPINFNNNTSCASNILQNVLMDGFSGAPDCPPGSENTCIDVGSAEVTIDTELMAAFVPDVSNILVYESPNTEQGWEDEWTQIATDNKAKIISCSWGSTELYSPTITFDQQIFQQMAAQGQAVFASSGDYGAYDDPPFVTLCVDEPAAQPYVTAVGISLLSTNANGTYNSETASIFGGGGISAFEAIPSYQTTLAAKAVGAAMVSTTMRNLPDVVLTADASTAYVFYINGTWNNPLGINAYYGSSLSTPIWASFMTLVNQELGSDAQLGFANPSLYKMAQTNYTNDFHDITTGNNDDNEGGDYLGYPAEIGFDDATGIGSFNGLNLFTDLVNQYAAIPLAPTGVTATAENSQVLLSWSPGAGDASYYVQRSTVNNGPYTTIAVTAQTTYLDTTASNSTTYYYVVLGVNVKGQSGNSKQVSATPSALIPLTPSNLSATSGNAQVVLKWSASAEATSYNIKRSFIAGGPYTTIINTVNTSYTNTSLLNGTTYYYVVSAVDAKGQSANSVQVSAMPLATPANLSATASNLKVVLQWTSGIGDTSYNVQRATISGGPYTTIASSAATTYSDTTVSNGTAYYYVVSAENAGGQSPNSAQVSATPLAPPANLNAAAGNATVALTWTAGAGDSSYQVIRSTISGGPFTSLATSITHATYTDASVVNGTTYYYTVNASNASGTSASFPQVSATPMAPPLAPVSIGIFPGNSEAALSWSASTGAASYTVKRSTVSGGTYTTIASGVTATNYTDSSVKVSSTYYYVISAVNVGGQSPNSVQVSGTILTAGHSAGDIDYWNMNGVNYVSGQPFPGGIANGGLANWRLVGKANLHGKGDTDLMWQNTQNGGIYYWLVDGNNVTSQGYFPGGGPTAGLSSWRLVGSANLHGAGDTDLIWQNTGNGQPDYWIMNGVNPTIGGGFATNPGIGWRLVGSANLHGAGDTDLIWQNTGNGQLAYWIMNGVNPTIGGGFATNPGTSWRLVGSANLHGAGDTDLLLQNITTGQIDYWIMSGETIISSWSFSVNPGPTWQLIGSYTSVPGTADNNLFWQYK